MGNEFDPSLIRSNPKTRVPLRIEEVAAAAGMAALGLITFANVVVRYLTDYSFAFTEEYSIALMVVVAMLGTSIAAAADRHVRITWFSDRLPPRLHAAAEMVAAGATILMFLILVGLGARLVWDEYRFEVTSPGLGEPQWIYTLALPLLSAAVAGRALGHLLRLRRLGKSIPPDPFGGPGTGL